MATSEEDALQRLETCREGESVNEGDGHMSDMGGSDHQAKTEAGSFRGAREGFTDCPAAGKLLRQGEADQSGISCLPALGAGRDKRYPLFSKLNQGEKGSRDKGKGRGAAKDGRSAEDADKAPEKLDRSGDIYLPGGRRKGARGRGTRKRQRQIQSASDCHETTSLKKRNLKKGGGNVERWGFTKKKKYSIRCSA